VLSTALVLLLVNLLRQRIIGNRLLPKLILNCDVQDIK
jgi:hypothetical protein